MSLVQGRLEIGCKVTIRMPAAVKNHILVDKYLKFVKELYIELKEEVIFGSSLSQVAKPGVEFSSWKADKDIRAKVGCKQKVQEKKKSGDICQMFEIQICRVLIVTRNFQIV